MMTRSTTDPIRKWDLSRCIVKEFLGILKIPSISVDNNQINFIENLIPNKIEISLEIVTEPMLSLLYNEIIEFNQGSYNPGKYIFPRTRCSRFDNDK